MRIAVLAMTSDSGPGSGRTAKTLTKLLLADPLKAEEDWERQLEGHDSSQPLIIRVGRPVSKSAGARETLSYGNDSLLPEISVSSPT